MYFNAVYGKYASDVYKSDVCNRVYGRLVME